MKSKSLIFSLALLLLPIEVASAAPKYSTEKTSDHGVDIVRLTDAANGVEVSIAPSIGDRLYEMKVHGKDIFNTLPAGDDFKKQISAVGIPFLAPWANRLNEQGYWANGKKYTLNMTLGNIRGGAVPIHGVLLSMPPWEVVEVKADGHSAHITSRFQFWKYPDMVAQWPFAQEYEMTYELSDGALEVRLTVTNLSAEPMPIVIGFHPCFQIPGVDRDDLRATIAATKMVVMDEHLVATGEMKPLDLPNPFSVKEHPLDTGFTDFQPDAQGRTHFSFSSGEKKIDVAFGPKFPTAQIYTPPRGKIACFEPMAGITNAVNLNHEGKYPALQILAPGKKWTESFWVRSNGI